MLANMSQIDPRADAPALVGASDAVACALELQRAPLAAYR
jgi:hypothetical protein